MPCLAAVRRNAQLPNPTSIQPVSISLSPPLRLPPPFPLGPLLIITPAKLGILVLLLLLLRRRLPQQRLAPLDLVRRDKIPGIQRRILMLPDHLPQPLVPRVHQLQRRQPPLVLHTGTRPGLEHHLDEGVAEGALLGGLAVDPAHGAVQRGVAVGAADGVALEAGLVQQGVDDLVVAARGGLVVQVVAEHGGGGVEEVGDGVVVVLQRGQDLGEEVDVVAPAGFD